MIEIYQGRIGGGKSYASIGRIAEHLAKGGWVYSNIEINPEGSALTSIVDIHCAATAAQTLPGVVSAMRDGPRAASPGTWHS